MIGADRRVTSFNLSIGSGLAMETLFTPTDVVYDNTRVFDKFDVKDIDTLIISWYTMTRNVIESLSARDKARVFETNKVKEISALVNSEMQVIESLCSGVGLRLVVLAPDYTKQRLLMVDTSKPTAKNMIYNIATRSKEKSIFDTVESIKLEHDSRAMLFSHISMDLAFAPQRQIVCLESNTGKVLKLPHFGKKLRKSVHDTSFLPLFPELLAIFGDSSGLLKVAMPKLKELAVTTLHAGHVTQTSSRQRVKTVISREPDLRGILNLNRLN